MNEGNVDVELARFDGRLSSTDERVRRVEQDVTRNSEKVSALHGRLDNEIDTVRRDVTDDLKSQIAPLRTDIGLLSDGMRDLREWRARVVGLAVGITLGSGMVSGAIVGVVVNAVGGG